MKNKYIYSLFIGLILLFQLQLLSYTNYLLVKQDLINGVLDPYLLLKTPLIIIPCIFFVYSIYGFKKSQI
ncbi:hypothetical protein IGJ45_003348 [Enterococcus sp. DIV0574]|uniref:Uncharacterized protein n=1 Tax=Enterococcus gallinarum TaxID=1353 RepID=A0A376L4T2_ENTGA|nr:hypothetical protein [Enterococcus faecalis]EGO8429244.1 hypothetical protein [Enterococcus faecalis]STE01560.1 Uncharacterised protein [Enterococcus gallinarum]STF08784.1 Uncharacterised protein [Enterococcus gallinarum]